MGAVFVGGASRVFFRSGLGCWTPLSLRQKDACCQRLGSGKYTKQYRKDLIWFALFMLLLLLFSSNAYDEVPTADIEAYIKYRACKGIGY